MCCGVLVPHHTILTVSRRWLVHNIATYYGLRTWSVTVGDPARREAYVGIKGDKACESLDDAGINIASSTMGYGLKEGQA